MSDPGASADEDDRRELYEQLLQLLRTRVQDINARLQALSAEIDSAGFEGRAGTPDGAAQSTAERSVAQNAVPDAAARVP